MSRKIDDAISVLEAVAMLALVVCVGFFLSLGGFYGGTYSLRWADRHVVDLPFISNYETPAEMYSRLENEPDPTVTTKTEAFENLRDGDRIQPGFKYAVVSKADWEKSAHHAKASSCSYGWMLTSRTNPSRVFATTAGHCGEPGDVVLMDTPLGYERVGEFVSSVYDRSSRQHAEDWALIEFDDQFTDMVTANPYIDKTITGWVDPGSLPDNARICRIGFRTGLSCGSNLGPGYDDSVTFYSTYYSDNGDSGGAVFAYDPKSQSYKAVGVHNFRLGKKQVVGGYTSLEAVFDEYALELMTEAH